MDSLPGLLDAAGEEGGGGLLYWPSWPDRASGVVPPVRQSFAQLRAEAGRILGALQSGGVRRGELVELALGRPRDLIPALWACLLGGLVPVPRPAPADAGAEPIPAAPSPPLPRSDRRRSWGIRRDGEAAGDPGGQWFALSDLRRAGPVGTPAPGGGNDTALLLATSGTTGLPRWVALSHRNVLSSVTGSAQVNGYNRDDVSLNWLPLHHVGGLLRSLREVCLGCLQIQVPTEAVAGDPLLWLDLVDEHRVTMTWAPNFAFGLLVASLRARGTERGPWNLRSLRSLHSSGELVSGRTVLELWRELAAFGLPATALHTAWGMTEVCFATCSHRLVAELRRYPHRVPSVGRPIPGVAMRIVDDEGRPQPEGAAGHLQVRGPAVGRYLDEGAPEPPSPPHGWLATGDLGSITDGVLTVTGRACDLIVVHGRKHSPRELETTVESVAGVVAGTAVACSLDGDAAGVALFFVPQPAGAEEIGRLVHECRERVARRHGLTVRWVLPVAAEAIPRSPMGKMKRRLLGERWVAGQLAAPRGWPYDLHGEMTGPAPAAPPGAGSSDGPADEVAGILAFALGREAVGRGENFFALGGDSLRAMQAVNGLRESYPAAGLSPADLYRWPTAEALAARIAGLDASPPEAAARPGGSYRRRRRRRRLAAASSGGDAGTGPSTEGTV